jgi:hypothetical protein
VLCAGEIDVTIRDASRGKLGHVGSLLPCSIDGVIEARLKVTRQIKLMSLTHGTSLLRIFKMQASASDLGTGVSTLGMSLIADFLS